ncbi:MAG: hypothetical protein NTZ36_02695 [Candidatus Jorgensenbacteria bacterium]|nr:hypothetical protein [Candidatus Jorgensenbacteria bacterium]
MATTAVVLFSTALAIWCVALILHATVFTAAWLAVVAGVGLAGFVVESASFLKERPQEGTGWAVLVAGMLGVLSGGLLALFKETWVLFGIAPLIALVCLIILEAVDQR